MRRTPCGSPIRPQSAASLWPTKCPAVIVELNKDSKGNWEIDDTVEYTTVEKAVRSMETYDTKDKFATFEGEIYLMFKDGIVSSVVLVDKVAKDGHIKDNTTGKITEAAISKGDGNKLVATWTDNKAYVNYKYVVDSIWLTAPRSI